MAQNQSLGVRAAKLAAAAAAEVKARSAESQSHENARKAASHYQQGNVVRGTVRAALSARNAQVAREDRQFRDELIRDAAK